MKELFHRRQSGVHYDLSNHSSPYHSNDLEFSLNFFDFWTFWFLTSIKNLPFLDFSLHPLTNVKINQCSSGKTWIPAHPWLSSRNQKAWQTFGNIQNSWDCFFCLKVKLIKSSIIWDLYYIKSNPLSYVGPRCYICHGTRGTFDHHQRPFLTPSGNTWEFLKQLTRLNEPHYVVRGLKGEKRKEKGTKKRLLGGGERCLSSERGKEQNERQSQKNWRDEK